MTFDDKAEIVISQLRADRDRLQNAIDKEKRVIQMKLLIIAIIAFNLGFLCGAAWNNLFKKGKQ